MGKKSLITAVLCCMSCLIVFAQGQSEEEKERLRKAKISSATMMFHRYDVEGDLDPKGIKRTYEKYDAYGNLVMKVNYDLESAVEEKFTYGYNKEAIPVYMIHYDDEENIIDKRRMKYNDAGKLKEAEGLAEDNKYTIEVTFNTPELPASKVKISAKGDTIYLITWEYDEHGNKIKEQFNGEKQYHTIYEYDEHDNMITKTAYSGDRQGYRYEYTYDSEGRKTSKEKLDRKGASIDKFFYEYNDKGWLKVEKHYSNYLGYLEERMVYSYDAYGNIEEIKTWDSEDGMPIYLNKFVYRKRK